MRLIDDCSTRGYSIDIGTILKSPKGDVYSVYKNNVEYKLFCLRTPCLPPREVVSQQFYEQKKNEFEAVFKHYSELSKLSKQIGNGLIAPIDVFCSGRRLCYIEPSVHNLFSLDKIKDTTISEKMFALKSLCFTLCTLHKLGLVYGNLSYDTLRVTRTAGGKFIIKLFGLFDCFYSKSPLPPAYIMQPDIYQSPEMAIYRNGCHAASELITCATDIFSLGILFYEVLYGYLPKYFGKENSDILYRAVCSGESCKSNDDIPVEMQQLIRKMLDRNPDNRPNIYYIYEMISK